MKSLFITFLSFLTAGIAFAERFTFRNVQLIGVINEAEDIHLSVALVRYGSGKTATLKIGDSCPWDKTFFLSKIHPNELTFDSGRDIETIGRSPWSTTAKYEETFDETSPTEFEAALPLKRDELDEGKSEDRLTKLDIPKSFEPKTSDGHELIDDGDEPPATIEELIELLSPRAKE